VVSGCENRNDRKEVVCELCCAARISLDVRSVKHCKKGSVATEHVLDKLESKSHKTVSVGNHKLFESVRDCEVQYVEEASSFEIEARTDV
jgi:hypothetical protein